MLGYTENIKMVTSFTAYNAIVTCNVPDLVLFNGYMQAQRIATEIFDDNFQNCMDKHLMNWTMN
jgi:hypothetical protein